MTDAQYNPFSLKEKTVLVTGASSGIGSVTAKECSMMGATLVVTGRNEERLNNVLASLYGEGHLAVSADLTENEGLEALVKSVPDLDGLVLAAGVNGMAPIKFATRKKIDKIFDTNLFSQIELIRLLCKNKKLKANSSIVAISSVGGSEVFTMGQGIYGASKAALLSWMKYIAKELAQASIRANCILPGHVETPMNDNLGLSDEQLKSYQATIPLKRFGKPEDIANGVVYLLSDASNWMTGSTLKIDGGTTL